MSEEELQSLIEDFVEHMIANQKDIEPEFVKIVEEDFWELLA